MLRKIVSGGQTGADRAGWDAALEFGLETGGWMPSGFLALDGLHPEFAAKYGARETRERDYPPRTRMNVRDSDATIIINFGLENSRGTTLAIGACVTAGKPKMVVTYTHQGGWSESPASVARWIEEHGVATLNVAGNREADEGGVYAISLAYLRRLFSVVKEGTQAI
jgi:hypothetical protein